MASTEVSVSVVVQENCHQSGIEATSAHCTSSAPCSLMHTSELKKTNFTGEGENFLNLKWKRMELGVLLGHFGPFIMKSGPSASS